MRLLLALLLAAGTLPACSNGESSEAETVFQQALEHCWNGEYPLAKPLFDRYIELVPTDPAGYWRKFINEYFRLRRELKTSVPKLSDEEYQKLKALAEKTIGLAQTSNTRDASFNQYIHASTLGILALLEVNNESKWTAKKTIKEVVRIIEKSKYQDDWFLLGSINYEASKYWIPATFAGIPCNREKGRALIYQAAAKNHSPFVDDIWFFIFGMERDNLKDHPDDPTAKAETESVGARLHRKYPRNKELNDFYSSDHR